MSDCSIGVKDASTLLVPIYDGIETPHYRVEKVTREDVLDYLSKYGTDFRHSLRHLGNIKGDWRCLDAIVQKCIEIFNQIDMCSSKR